MKKIPSEDKAGLYITVSVHLAVLIVLLATGLGFSLQRENSFVLDFSKLDEIERLQQELEFKQQINRQLEERLAEQGITASSAIRNVAVDRSALRDDRGTDAAELYRDAERLQRELEGGFKAPDESVAEISPEINPAKQDTPPKKETYSGPSVLSYELSGRKASKLPIPAYRCMGKGEVKVNITVDNSGNVTMAKVDDGASSSDSCLRNFAIRAARLSKFSMDPKAPAAQKGSITYQFIAQ
ncbi:MAG: energy transducer TonB [Bacteroidales bacterium]|nr:energy transducer TonB [Bacteroidales bacterium]